MPNIKSLKLLIKSLTYIGDKEPLSGFVKVVIIALDVFILFALFLGLAGHISQITTPIEYAPNKCKEAFITKKWDKTNNLTNLGRIVLLDYHNYQYRYKPIADTKTTIMHPLCANFYQKIQAIITDKKINALFIKREDLVNKRDNLRAQFNQHKREDDTVLLESIANKTKLDIDIKSKKYIDEIDNYSAKISQIDTEINQQQTVKDLVLLLDDDNNKRDELIADFKDFQFWYQLKKILWELLFLLPIFAVFYFWRRRSMQKEQQVNTLIASHLLVIATIPILITISDFILYLIPYHFFRYIFELLASWHLIAIWYYIVIALAVTIGVLIVYLMQKKIFSPERISMIRLAAGKCYACGVKLPADTLMCPFCSKEQLTTCGNCNKKTNINTPYCKYCGHNMQS